MPGRTSPPECYPRRTDDPSRHRGDNGLRPPHVPRTSGTEDCADDLSNYGNIVPGDAIIKGDIAFGNKYR